jgi:hypothetical protein
MLQTLMCYAKGHIKNKIRTDNAKVQKDKQWSTKPFTETKAQVTQAPLKPSDHIIHF